MATRNDYQIALDVIKTINIINDLVDYASYILRDIDPSTGGAYLNRNTEEPYSVLEIKQQLAVVRTNLTAYNDLINNYIAKVGASRVVTALNTLNIDALETKADMDNLKAVIEHVIPDIQAAVTKQDLIVSADYIDANTAKLELIRRSWSL